jgi:CSLREA domain-containing protein
MWVGPAPTRAGAQHVVNSTGDLGDDNSLDGTCDTGEVVIGDPACTLRAAIEQANWDADPDTTITFDPGLNLGGMLIQPATALPVINTAVTIDASSAWSLFGDVPGITLSGGDQSFAGLKLNAGNCEIYGLEIISFTHGIVVYSNNNTIGGTGAGQRNIVSSNLYSGINLYAIGAYNNVVQGNWIGLNTAGNAKAPNSTGVLIDGGASQNTIGGDAASKGNYISGNLSHGVYIEGADTDQNEVNGNVIGLPAVVSLSLSLSPAADVGNGGSGICIQNGPKENGVGDVLSNTISSNGGAGVLLNAADSNHVYNNSISGSGLNGVTIQDGANNLLMENTIANNTGDGVHIDGAAAIGNKLLYNSIHHNTGKGIELENGGNTELDPPTITTANASGASGTTCASCPVQVFSDSEDEGQTYHATVSSDASGNWWHSGALTGPNVTAITTNLGNNTSEFSTPYTINQPPNEPSNPSPADGATGVALGTSLSWTGGDPDAGDTVTYTVHFGTADPPPLAQSGLTTTSYSPTLSANTSYYWQIVAQDNHGATTSGEVWDFTTGSQAQPKVKAYLPIVIRNP